MSTHDIDGSGPDIPFARDRGQVRNLQGGLDTRPALPEIEWGLLHRALNDQGDALRMTALLTPDAFDAFANRQVFEAIAACVADAEKPDLMSVAARLRIADSDIGLNRAFEIVSEPKLMSYDVNTHCLLLIEQQMKRKQIVLANWLQQQALDPTSDAIDVQDKLERDAFEIMPNLSKKSVVQPKTVTGDLFEQYAANETDQSGLLGIPTPFAKLDRHIRGWRDGKQHVALAAPGMGKTAFGLGSLRTAAITHGHGTAYFSVEMEADELTDRLLIGEAGVNANDVAEGRLLPSDWEALHAARARIDAAPIFLDATPRLHIDHIVTQIRRLVRFEGVRFVIVDYLQRISFEGKADNYERGISYISNTLKELARELKIPILTLSQITREKAKEGKEPGKHDARGSGDVENDADVILTIYRPEEVDVTYSDEHKMYTAGLGIIGVPKIRNGKPMRDRILCAYEGDSIRFVDRPPGGQIDAFPDEDLPF